MGAPGASTPLVRHPPAMVGILGGMGPAAGADFVRLFVQACTQLLQASGRPVTDQAYPEHWLAQVPVPDRTAALQGAAAPSRPREAMKQVVARLSALGARTFAIACNTAHAWHGELQSAFPDLDVIDGVREVAAQLARARVGEVGLLATEGTYTTGLYQRALAREGITCRVPERGEQSLLMEGIYSGVKAGDLALAHDRFTRVAAALAGRHGCRTLVLGCTEIPLALQPGPATRGLALVDPAERIARALALRAYGVPADAAVWPRSA